jgi:hypothetical protein
MLSAALILILTATAFGGDTAEKTTYFGVKAGIISPGAFYVSDREFDSDMSYSIGGFLDYQLGPKIFGGLSLNINGFGAYEETTTMFDLNANLKARIANEKNSLIFRPGLEIGYANMGSLGSSYESSNYLLLKGIVEVLFPSEGNLTWLGEIGIVGAPDGGNDDHEMTFGPGFFLRGGILF